MSEHAAHQTFSCLKWVTGNKESSTDEHVQYKASNLSDFRRRLIRCGWHQLWSECAKKKTKTSPSSLPGYQIWHNVCWYKKLGPLLSRLHLHVWGPLRCSAANKGRGLLSAYTGDTGQRQTGERMATLVESADMETLGVQSNTGASPTSSSPSQHFNDSKFYLLVVIGEITTEDHLKCAIADIEKGKMELREVGAGHRKLTNLTISITACQEMYVRLVSL